MTSLVLSHMSVEVISPMDGRYSFEEVAAPRPSSPSSIPRLSTLSPQKRAATAPQPRPQTLSSAPNLTAFNHDASRIPVSPRLSDRRRNISHDGHISASSHPQNIRRYTKSPLNTRTPTASSLSSTTTTPTEISFQQRDSLINDAYQALTSGQARSLSTRPTSIAEHAGEPTLEKSIPILAYPRYYRQAGPPSVAKDYDLDVVPGSDVAAIVLRHLDKPKASSIPNATVSSKKQNRLSKGQDALLALKESLTGHWPLSKETLVMEGRGGSSSTPSVEEEKETRDWPLLSERETQTQSERSSPQDGVSPQGSTSPHDIASPPESISPQAESPSTYSQSPTAQPAQPTVTIPRETSEEFPMRTPVTPIEPAIPELVPEEKEEKKKRRFCGCSMM